MRLLVHLAEAPTDILVWLVKTQPRGGTQHEIVAAMAPLASNLALEDTRSCVSSALRLLRELRLVSSIVGVDGQPKYYATREGVEAIEAAR